MAGIRKTASTKASTLTIHEQLPSALAAAGPPGDFAVGGRRVTPMPTLHVEGVGVVAFPLLPAQAQALIAVAERAPYGRGSETLVDTGVRRSWQLAPAVLAQAPLERQRIWRQTLARIVRRATAGLGVEGTVRAALYKVLVYEPGDFFVPHRDTEKVDGMFATLVVSLPSLHEGGALVVRHQGETRRFDLRVEAPSRVAWTAFYADCVHELEPVTSGYRLALVYNLVWEAPAGGRKQAADAKRPALPPDRSDAVAAVAMLLRAWSAGPAPTRLISVLEHHYTTANLSFTRLKSPDAAAAAVLLAAARHVNCVCHLAMVSIFEAGSADPVEFHSRWSRRSSHYDDASEDYEVVEVDQRTQRIEGLIAAPGEASFGAATAAAFDPHAGMSFELDEVSPPGAIDSEAPDEQHFTEATGNEGGSFERTYRRAAIVIWPRTRELEMLAQADPGVGLPLLRQLIGSGDARATTLALAMIDAWPVAAHGFEWAPMSEKGAADAARWTREMLAALASLGDATLVSKFVATALEATGIRVSDCDSLLAAAEATGWQAASPWLVHLAGQAVAGTGQVAAAAVLLEGLASRLDEGSKVVRAVAEAVGWAACDALTSDESTPKKRPRCMDIQPPTLARLVQAFARISPPLAAQAEGDLVCTMRDGDTLVAIALARGPTTGTSSAMKAAAIKHLEERIERPLAPPSTWARDPATKCKCKHCAAASLFLADPQQQVWRLKAVEQDRRHVESELRRADLDFATVRGSSPLTLVCTKNLASYERRVAQRDGDLRDLARLAADS